MKIRIQSPNVPDIKPENILLLEGHAPIADFGIARSSLADDALTQTDGVVGTPAYLSPQQISGAAVYGRSDTYSLGCVLFECLVGEGPFGVPTLATISQRLTTPAPSARKLRAEIGDGLDRVLATALAIEADSRYPTAKAFAEEPRQPPATGAGPSQPIRTAEEARRAMVVLPFANQSPDPAPACAASAIGPASC